MKNFYFPHTELKIADQTIPQWAAQIGSTPFFIYDRTCIRERVSHLRSHLPDSVQILYAAKANPMPELLQFMANQVDGFDVSSFREIELSLSTGMGPERISFAGPGKTDSELRYGISAKILISMESLLEIRRVGKLSREMGAPARVGLRINPIAMTHSSGMKMGGGSRPFGIDTEQFPEALALLKKEGLELEGLHIYSGSQVLNAQRICEMHQQSFAFLHQMKQLLPKGLQRFNFGGGFGIPYSIDAAELDLRPVGEFLDSEIRRMQSEFPGVTPVMEFGRYLVGEAGVFISRIVDKKISRGETFLILDGGMNCLLAATGNLGQVIRRPYPMRIANKAADYPTEIVNVVGPLCTPLDSFATQIPLTMSEPGDYLAIFQSGAYGLTASPNNFLSHPVAKEILTSTEKLPQG